MEQYTTLTGPETVCLQFHNYWLMKLSLGSEQIIYIYTYIFMNKLSYVGHGWKEATKEWPSTVLANPTSDVHPFTASHKKYSQAAQAKQYLAMRIVAEQSRGLQQNITSQLLCMEPPADAAATFAGSIRLWVPTTRAHQNTCCSHLVLQEAPG